MGRGLFIVFEGLDKCGKSTQVDLLYRYLQERGTPCHKISFPERSSKTGITIDQYLSEKLKLTSDAAHELFSKNRWEFNDEIIGMLNSGKTVIADRYAFSGVAYSVAKGLDPDWCVLADRGLAAPDVVFFIDISPKEAAKRKGFGEERYENVCFQRKVDKAFEKLKGSEWVNLNGLLDEAQIHKKITLWIDGVPAKELGRLWAKQ